MDVQVCGRRDSRDEGEECAEGIDDERQHRVEDEAILEGGRDEVEEREHGEDGDEHVVVDDRRAALDCDHVADEGHAEEDPEKLCAIMSVMFFHLYWWRARCASWRSWYAYLDSSQCHVNDGHACGICLEAVVG